MNSRMFKKVVMSVFVGLMIYFLAVNFNDSSDPASYFSIKHVPSNKAPLSKKVAIHEKGY